MTWDSKSFAPSMPFRWLNSCKFWRHPRSWGCWILMVSGIPVTSLSSRPTSESSGTTTPEYQQNINKISRKCWTCSLSENLVFTEHKMVDRKRFFARQLFRWARCHTHIYLYILVISSRRKHSEYRYNVMSSPLMHWCWFSFTNYLVHLFGISDHQKPWNIRIDIVVNRTYLSWMVKDQWWNITINKYQWCFFSIIIDPSETIWIMSTLD